MVNQQTAIVDAEQLGSQTVANAQTTLSKQTRSDPQNPKVNGNPSSYILEAKAELGGLSDRLGLAIWHLLRKDVQNLGASSRTKLGDLSRRISLEARPLKSLGPPFKTMKGAIYFTKRSLEST